MSIPWESVMLYQLPESNSSPTRLRDGPAWLIRWNDPALSLGSYSRDSSLGILGKDQLEVVTGWGLNSSCVCFLFGRFGGKVVAGTQVLFENVKWFQDFLWIQYGSEVNKISQPHPQRGFHDFFRACRLFKPTWIPSMAHGGFWKRNLTTKNDILSDVRTK